MRILMMTNTYLPHVGGVARSVASFTEALRARGHQVLVVAPTFEQMDPDPDYVVRVPALQNFNGSDFSVRLPVPGLLGPWLDDFAPELVHAHHPFLLGDAAHRIAATRNLPLVFTHHTMYERYTHYVPGDSPALVRFVMALATQYANLADHVIAPSASIAAILRERGVTTSLTALPTGIDPAQFAVGDRAAARRRWGVPTQAFVVGYVGRLAEEKNLNLLGEAVARFLKSSPAAHFLLVGQGPAGDELKRSFAAAGLGERVHFTGALQGPALADAYHALDVFGFASKSETQGMVLAEAMMAGVPVVAIDAPGAREVVIDGRNGRLLMSEDPASLALALSWVANRSPQERARLATAARTTARTFSLPRCTQRLLAIYQRCVALGRHAPLNDASRWSSSLRRIEEEWRLWAGFGVAVSSALRGGAAAAETPAE